MLPKSRRKFIHHALRECTFESSPCALLWGLGWARICVELLQTCCCVLLLHCCITNYVPQVCKCSDLDEVERQGTKRKLEHDEQRAIRQKAWLGRRAANEKSHCRPIKLHRVAAKNWLANLDNQFRVSAAKRGLSFFMPDWELPQWKSWQSLPFAAIGMDLGSDGCTGAHALMHYWRLNMELVPDPSHGSQRSVILALKHGGLYPLMMLWMVHVNLLHGPDHENTRYTQMQEHLTKAHAAATPSKALLFLSLATKIVHALKSMKHEFDTESPEELQAWEILKERAAFLKEGKRSTMCRFQAIAGTLDSMLPWWPIHLYERVLVAMEEGYLNGKEYIEKFIVKAVAPADEPGEGGAIFENNSVALGRGGDGKLKRIVANIFLVVECQCC